MEVILVHHSSASETGYRHDIHHVHQWYPPAFRRVCKPDKGRPANTTITMSHYIYNNSFGQGVANFGYACAMSFFVFILVAILAAINLKVGDTRD